MNQQTLAARRVGPPQSDFERRIDALVTESGLSKSALGLNAGLSKSTVGNWIKKAAKGELRRTDDLYVFAQKYNRTVEWLLGETVLVELPPGALQPDTKAMADEAIEMLVDIDGMKPAEAAALMVGIRLDPPSLKGFYKAARLKSARPAPPNEPGQPPRKRH